MGRWRTWLGPALVVVGLIRAALVVFGGPMAGYGNQYDMHRTGACIGLFPALPAPANTEAFADGPLPVYRLDPQMKLPACYLSTEVALASGVMDAAQALGADVTQARLRWIGATKFALLAVVALLLAFALSRHPAAALVHGWVFLLVMADPAVTLWFNTLYTEFAILWGLYAVVGCLCALALGGRGATVLWLLLASALAALAFSREQFALLAPLLVLCAAPWLWRQAPSALALTFGVALVTTMISFGLMSRPPSIAEANRANAYLHLLLPASSDPPAALRAVGLPPHCAPAIGASWYIQRGEDLRATCPEALKLSSTAFLRFLQGEPQVLARAFARAFPAMQAVTPPYLGTLANSPRRYVDELPWWRGSLLHWAATNMPAAAFASAVILVILAAPAAGFLAAGLAVAHRGLPVGLLLAMLLGGTAAYAALTSIFGDGLSETARHFLAGWLATAAAVIAGGVGIAWALTHRPAEPRTWIAPLLGAAAGIALAAWICVAAFEWARAQPLSIGVVDEPAGRQLPPGEVRVLGWALDPAGIDRIEVALGDLRRAPVREPHPAMPRRVFPGYAQREQARFRAAFSAEEFAAATAAGPVTLRTTVTSPSGVTFEIDRRVLDRAR